MGLSYIFTPRFNFAKFFISLFFGLIVQTTDSQAQSHFADKADSLFNEKNYADAAVLYEELIAKHDINKKVAYQKLAYIYENKGEFSRAIYYLNEYYRLNPDEKVFDKINQMAKENSFFGYSRSDLNFFTLLIQQNSVWLILALLGIITYSFIVVFMKRAKNSIIPRSQKMSLLLGILLVMFIINFPRLYKTGIVNKKEVYVRDEPSAGAAMTNKLGEGSRVNIIGQKDIWMKLFLNRDVRYVKRTDLWIIGEE